MRLEHYMKMDNDDDFGLFIGDIKILISHKVRAMIPSKKRFLSYHIFDLSSICNRG